MEHESDDDTNCNWFALYSQKGLITGTGGLENKRTSEDSIIKIGQNTEKTPRDLKRCAVIQALVKDNQVRLQHC